MNSALPSVEPLSTTRISLRPIASMMDGRYFSSRSLPFQFGITTDARVRSGAVDGARSRPPNNFQARSTMASATAETNRSRGDRRIEGSALRNRFRNAMSLEGQDRAESDFAAELHPPRLADQRELMRQCARLRFQP